MITSIVLLNLIRNLGILCLDQLLEDFQTLSSSLSTSPHEFLTPATSTLTFMI